MKKLALLAMLSIAAISSAQTLNEYVALRKKHSVVQATSVDALDKLVGTKVLEIRCVVKGTMVLDDMNSIYVEYANGTTQVIDAKIVPDWLRNGDVSARLLVKATRETEYATVKAELLGAASDSDISTLERAAQAAKEKADASRKKAPNRSNTASRSSSSSRSTPKPVNQVVPIYANFIKNHNRKLSNAQAYEIANGVVGFSLKYDVDARLVVALLIAESDFDPNCTSGVGASGLGQLMPGTARELGVRNPYDTTENLYGTVKLLSQHLTRYNGRANYDQLALALAAYNAGPGAVKRFGGVPPYRETQKYVRKVIAIYDRLKA